MKNVFVVSHEGGWTVPASVLSAKLGFEIVNLNGKKYPSISNKIILLKKEWNNITNIIRKFKQINYSNVLICSNYVVVFLLFLKRVGILHVNKICWYGLFIHNPKMMKILGKIVSALVSEYKEFRAVVFSKSETELYATSWNMARECFLYVPYGDWQKNNEKRESTRVSDAGYFFSGGYSNRDYVPLIKLFEKRKERLVIAASHHNEDLVNYVSNRNLGNNIEIYYDIGEEYFENLHRGARASIFVMKHDTGASGQMVMLQAMKYRKLIICTQTEVLDEYVQNEQTGIVIKREEILEKLPNIITSVNKNPENYVTMIERAYKHYVTRYSFDAISESLVNEISKLI